MNQDNKQSISKTVDQYKPRYTSDYSEDAWEVRVSLPGVSKENLEVSVENEVLDISAIRLNAIPEGWNRLSGPVHDRQYRLRLDVGPEVDDQGIQAKLEHGELLIQLPLKTEVKPRVIPIH